MSFRFDLFIFLYIGESFALIGMCSGSQGRFFADLSLGKCDGAERSKFGEKICQMSVLYTLNLQGYIESFRDARNSLGYSSYVKVTYVKFVVNCLVITANHHGKL